MPVFSYLDRLVPNFNPRDRCGGNFQIMEDCGIFPSRAQILDVRLEGMLTTKKWGRCQGCTRTSVFALAYCAGILLR